MVRYLSSEPMFFGPPRVPEKQESVDILRDDERRCDHQGKPHIFNGYIWTCKDCGERL